MDNDQCLQYNGVQEYFVDIDSASLVIWDKQ